MLDGPVLIGFVAIRRRKRYHPFPFKARSGGLCRSARASFAVG